MNTEEIKKCLSPHFLHCDITVQGEGNKFNVLIVGDVFSGLTPVKRQQGVYACINEYIASGAIHAVTMKLYTREEWQKARHFQTMGG